MARARPTAVFLLGVLTAALLSGLTTIAAPSAGAATLVPVSGAGSTWSQNALDQWRRNVNQFGMRVNYNGTGSSDGRNQFKNGTVDFAVSEIPYGLTDNGVTDAPPGRGFAYMPIVAGGTAFMYNLKAAGKRITNLRLTGEQVTKIFTGQIKMWNDPVLTAENPGLQLPARPIVPVVRSDGSGTTAQFTLWMSKQYPSLWTKGQTSNFPRSGNMLALAGSLGVAGYVSQNQNEGTITYVEESYALNTGFPVVKLLNKANYYVEPKSDNVAIALLEARINPDLTQNLDGVYNNADKRAYPLSSYSYMIVPTKLENGINNDKGYTLSRFAGYFLCQGQQAAPELGYSPLPKNLVQAGLDVVKRIPGHDPAVTDISKCQNPTFSSTSDIKKTAKNPLECDRKGGPTQCTDGTGGAKTPTQNSGGGGNTAGGGAPTPVPPTSGGGAPAPTPVPGAPVDPTGGVPPASGGVPPTTTDPLTGLPTTPTNNLGDVASTATSLNGGTGDGMSTVLVFFAGMIFAALVIGPPLAARRFSTPPPGSGQ